MIISKKLNDELVQNTSDKGVKLLNSLTGETYDAPVDVCNEKREEMGLPPISYVETDIPVDPEV